MYVKLVKVNIEMDNAHENFMFKVHFSFLIKFALKAIIIIWFDSYFMPNINLNEAELI